MQPLNFAFPLKTGGEKIKIFTLSARLTKQLFSGFPTLLAA